MGTSQHSGDAPGTITAGAQQVQEVLPSGGICLEAQQATAMHRVAGCGRSFCRDCLRAYAIANCVHHVCTGLCLPHSCHPPRPPPLTSLSRRSKHGGCHRPGLAQTCSLPCRCPDAECRRPLGALEWEALLPTPEAAQLRRREAEKAIPEVSAYGAFSQSEVSLLRACLRHIIWAFSMVLEPALDPVTQRGPVAARLNRPYRPICRGGNCTALSPSVQHSLFAHQKQTKQRVRLETVQLARGVTPRHRYIHRLQRSLISEWSRMMLAQQNSRGYSKLLRSYMVADTVLCLWRGRFASDVGR